MANFIGFEPAEYQKKMKLLDEVIKLKARNKDAAEQAQGYQVEAVRKAAAQTKSFRDEIQRQNALMLSFRSNKDILEAKQQLTQAQQLKKDQDVIAAKAPGDQGEAKLAQAYGLQEEYAQSKLKLLESMRDSLKAKTPNERNLKNKEIEDRMDAYQEAMDDFMDFDIPVGFIQVVDIRTLPQQPQQTPGAPSSAVNVPGTPSSQPQLPPPPAPAEDVILDIYKSQQPQGDIKVGANTETLMFITDKADQKAKGPVTLVQYGGNDAVYGKVKGDNVIFDTKLGKKAIKAEDALRILSTMDWNTLSKDDLKRVVALYVAAFQDPNILFSGPQFNDLDLEIYDLVAGNPFLNEVAFELNAELLASQAPPKGQGIVRDVLGLARKSLTPKKQVRGPPRLVLGPSGEYGNVRVDMPALLNRGRVRVMRGGSVVLDEVEENVDGFGLSRLITKRVMQKTIDAAPPKVRKQYERLNKLASAAAEISKNAAKTKGSGVQPKIKITKKPENIVVVGNGAELAQRLKIATGLYVAGNRSSENVQLITELAHAMLKMGKISHERYADILDTYTAE